jgi:lipopolysaccharide/colanic/teichoic acid biosynthesis glycosyltransferase
MGRHLPIVRALCPLAIKLSSPGPILFRQERVTKGRRKFKAIKFRTMAVDGDAILAAQGINPSQPFFKLGEDDPRISRLGGFLRKTSLDELPQLWNVVRGQMSLVGPRPLPSDQIEANLELLGPV